MVNKLIRFGICIGTIYLILKFVNAEHAETAYQNFASISWHIWLELLTLSLIIFFLLALMFQASMKVVSVNLPFQLSFNYTSMNTFFNTVLPLKGGVWIRGLYLKKHYNVSWKNYVFVVVTSQVVQMTILAVMLLIAIFQTEIELYDFPSFLYKIEIECIGIAIVALSFILLFISKLNIASEILFRLNRGVRLWLDKPNLVIWYIGLVILLNMVSGLRLWLSFLAVGELLSLTNICILFCSLGIGLSWAFTPGNIGVREAATVLISSLFGIDIGTALTASLLDRAASIFVIIVVGGAAAYVSTKSLNKPEAQ